jgi:hypothetical protein
LDPVKIRNHKNLYSVLNIVIPLALILIMGIILIIIRKLKYSRK